MSEKSSPSSRGRRRHLTDEEKILWDGVARSLKPLRRKAKAAAIKMDEVANAPSKSPLLTKPKKLLANEKLSAKDKHVASRPAPAKAALPPAPPKLASFTRKTKSRVARGIDPIHARIDLHGMIQDEAHDALLRFVARASGEGASLVLVITGKGRIADENRERGVLRRRVPQWLGEAAFRKFVVGFEEAHIGHGGEGALYVRLRKKRLGGVD